MPPKKKKKEATGAKSEKPKWMSDEQWAFSRSIPKLVEAFRAGPSEADVTQNVCSSKSQVKTAYSVYVTHGTSHHCRLWTEKAIRWCSVYVTHGISHHCPTGNTMSHYGRNWGRYNILEMHHSYDKSLT
jgi:hypothetical protein